MEFGKIEIYEGPEIPESPTLPSAENQGMGVKAVTMKKHICSRGLHLLAGAADPNAATAPKPAPKPKPLDNVDRPKYVQPQRPGQSEQGSLSEPVCPPFLFPVADRLVRTAELAIRQRWLLISRWRVEIGGRWLAVAQQQLVVRQWQVLVH